MDKSERKSNEGQGMSFKQAYRPFFLEYALLAELNLVRRQKPVGVFVIPANASPLIWFGIIFIRQGHYEGGAFKFTIYIPDSFPDCDCPTVIFESPPYHPMISASTGEFDTSKSFAKWKKGANHLWQLLLSVRRSFFQFDVNQPFNLEAANLFQRDPNLFKHKATESVKLANKRLLDAPSSCDPHALAFKQMTEEEFENIRADMTARDSKERSETSSRSTSTASFKSKGLSWVKPGSMTIFSKDTSFPPDGVVDADGDGDHLDDDDDDDHRDDVGDDDDDGGRGGGAAGVSEKEDDPPDEA